MSAFYALHSYLFCTPRRLSSICKNTIPTKIARPVITTTYEIICNIYMCINEKSTQNILYNYTVSISKILCERRFPMKNCICKWCEFYTYTIRNPNVVKSMCTYMHKSYFLMLGHNYTYVHTTWPQLSML